eukprot:6984904-Pyramimonas_sp.AAC.2
MDGKGPRWSRPGKGTMANADTKGRGLTWTGVDKEGERRYLQLIPVVVRARHVQHHLREDSITKSTSEITKREASAKQQATTTNTTQPSLRGASSYSASLPAGVVSIKVELFERKVDVREVDPHVRQALLRRRCRHLLDRGEDVLGAVDLALLCQARADAIRRVDVVAVQAQHLLVQGHGVGQPLHQLALHPLVGVHLRAVLQRVVVDDVRHAQHGVGVVLQLLRMRQRRRPRLLALRGTDQSREGKGHIPSGTNQSHEPEHKPVGQSEEGRGDIPGAPANHPWGGGIYLQSVRLFVVCFRSLPGGKGMTRQTVRSYIHLEGAEVTFTWRVRKAVCASVQCPAVMCSDPTSARASGLPGRASSAARAATIAASRSPRVRAARALRRWQSTKEGCASSTCNKAQGGR